MNNDKKYIFGLLALIIVFSTALPGSAAANKNMINAAPVSSPVVFEGDDLSFSEVTGEVFAKGNVKIQKDQTVIETEALRGNTKESTIWIESAANFSQPGMNLIGSGVEYNYKVRSGLMDQVQGKIGYDIVSANHISMNPEEVILHDGTVTRCPAKVPDYHVSADKIEVWPGKKLIAYNAKFWIKDKVIFSLPKYQKSLREKDQSESDFPQIGYSSQDGIFINQHLEYPINEHVAAFANLAYYTKSDFKPNYGLINRTDKYDLSLVQGHYRDDDDNWIKKEPEIKLNYFGGRLGQAPIRYNLSAVYGKWIDDDKSSWHQDYLLYFTHDPIKLGNTMTLSLGTGFQWIYESYDNSTQEVFRYDAKLTKEFSPRLSTWVGYHYRDQEATLFDYDTPDLNKELDTGFTYKIDKMNAFTFNQSYDMENSRVYDQDYTWHRDLHCWQADITYRAKRDEIRLKIKTKQW